jgi:hypothetical protein
MTPSSPAPRSPREALVAARVGDGHVGHRDRRDVGPASADRAIVELLLEADPRIEDRLVRRLDRRSVHDRVRERQPDLDDVGTRLDGRTEARPRRLGSGYPAVR